MALSNQLMAEQGEQEDWKELVRQAREQIRAELGERQLPPPEEMIRQLREERDAQLLALRRRQPGHYALDETTTIRSLIR